MIEHEYLIKDLLREAYKESMKSPDPSTQNGALIVDHKGRILTWAHNKFPEGVKYLPERWERPLKYKVIEHAERNAIYQMARSGDVVDGHTMVCPWAACADCARAIIQSGILKIITHKQAHDRSPPFWLDEIKIAFQMFEEAGVKVVMYDGNLDFEHEVLHTGVRWKP